VLRIAVESGGCHGFQYIFALKGSSDINPDVDCVFERNNAKIVVDATSLEILQQSTVDYTSELIGSQFKVVNSPFATSSCGCGSSFAFDPTAAKK
jgi:iron-sulfur cluster assembly accessory protein